MMQRYSQSKPVTPSDTVDIATNYVSDGFFVTGAGVVQAVLQDGTVIPVTAGASTVWPFAIKRVNATSTTATGIIALKK
jgi:hypothetical protein